MLKLNLKELMDEKGLTIQDVYEKTGISRNTISLLYNGKSKGIQLSTINKLVNYLDLFSVSELFVNETNYSDVHASIVWGKKLENNHNKKTLENLFSLAPSVADKDSFFNIPFFSLSFVDGENELFKLPLSISEQSTNEFFQLEGLFDLINKNDKAFQINNSFSDLVKNIGNNKMERLISYAFSKFIFKVKKILPESLNYIGFRTDFGDVVNDNYSISLLWLVEDLADKSKNESLLNMKFG